MTNNVHVTQPRDGSVEHHWSVGDEHGSVSLTASHFTGSGYDDMVAVAPSSADVMAQTADGFWVFSVVEYHGAGCTWAQDPPGSPEDPQAEDCNGGGVASSLIALPLWDRVRTADLTDDAVFTALTTLHANEFKEHA